MIRKIILMAALAVALSLPLGAQEFVSKWKLTKSTGTSFEQLFAKDSMHIGANECGNAYIEAPKMTELRKDDCWVIHIPVENVKAGSYVGFCFTFGGKSTSRSHFAVEYLEGKEWKNLDNIFTTGNNNAPNSIMEIVKVKKNIRKGEVLARIRATEDCAQGSSFKLMPYGYIAGYSSVMGTQAPKDTTKVGWLGNSFTFVNSADFVLKELAWYEGHFLDLHVSTYPGAYFRTHFGYPLSMDVMSEGGYDYFILQDQSEQAARFGRDSTVAIVQFTKAISQVIKYFSPSAKVIIEQTWAFSQNNYAQFGSFEAFDENSTKGAKNLAKITGATVSPIAAAFAVVRSERPDIEIYSTDNHHPAAYGAYLKACVDYQVIFKQPFKSDKACFGLDPEVCAYLRKVAEKVVLSVSAIQN